MTTREMSAPDDPYALLPFLYDLEHDTFSDDVPLLLHFAQQTTLPTIELGCGSGRILQAFANEGESITGVDQSIPMLDAALRRISTHEHGAFVTLVEGDMRSVNQIVTGPFGLAAFTLNALMHLPSVEDQLTALTSVRDILDAEGTVLIDLMNPHPEQLVHLGSGPLLEGSWTLPNGDVIDKWSHRVIHPASQVIETTIWYDTVRPDGGLRRIRTTFDHRYVHAAELRFMLERGGFLDIDIYGGYELEPFDDDADRLIAIARKRA